MNRVRLMKKIRRWNLKEKYMELALRKWLYKGGNSYQDYVFYCESVNKKYFERERKYYHKYTDGKEFLYKFKKRYRALMGLELLLKIIVYSIPLVFDFVKTNTNNYGYKKIKE